MKNLFDFADTKIYENKEDLGEKLKENNIDEGEIKKSYEKYKNFSKDDLASEFINVVKRQKQAGSLDNAKINNVIDKLSPYINEQQKQFLQQLIEKSDE